MVFCKTKDFFLLARISNLHTHQYHLNGETEYFDPLEKTTTSCPLLPSQQVNVLEVPTQSLHPQLEREGSHSPIDPRVFTLDPQVKYLSSKSSIGSLTPPAPRPSHSNPRNKPQSIRPGRLVAQVRPEPEILDSQVKPDRLAQSAGVSCAFPGTAAIMAAFYKLRGNKSADAILRPKMDLRNDSAARNPFRPIGQDFVDTSGRNLRLGNVRAPVNTPQSTCRTSLYEESASTHDRSPSRGGDCASCLHGHTNSLVSKDSRYYTPSGISQSYRDFFDEYSQTNSSELEHDRANVSPYIDLAKSESTSISVVTGSIIEAAQHLHHAHLASTFPAPPQCTSPPPSSIESNMALSIYQPRADQIPVNDKPKNLLALRLPTASLRPEDHPCSIMGSNSFDNGQLSPYELSQLESPSVRDFEAETDILGQSQSETRDTSFELALRENNQQEQQSMLVSLHSPRITPSGFQGYGLPEDEQASALTLRKLPSSGFLPIRNDATPAIQNSNDVFQSWNANSSHHMSALEELVDDLGYMGQLIS